MTTITATPVRHQVFNAFDEHGVLLNLKRIAGESNASYKQRLLDVFVHRASAAYKGLLNGITRELGLSYYDAMVVECDTDGSGNYLLANPSVTFEGASCILYSNADPNNEVIYQEIDINDPSELSYWLGGLISTINATGYFTASLAPEADPWSRSMCIYDQSLTGNVVSESLVSSSNRIKLTFDNLITGTVSVSSSNLTDRVSSQSAVVKSGQYYIDLEHGILYTLDTPSTNSYIRYLYRTEPKTFEASPVIIGHLQRGTFREKLFERLTDEYGEEYDSIVSVFGLDVINELFSRVNLYWGI